MFIITLILLCTALLTALLGGLLIDIACDEWSPCVAFVGCLMLAAGLFASIYYSMALTQ